MQPETMDYLLDAMTEVNAKYPIRQLRWSITTRTMSVPHRSSECGTWE